MPDSRKLLNLPVLKRHDASIVDIVDQFSHVQLYRWDGSAWTKDAIQGPLFLFKRSGHPRYGFFILNKHGLKNFSENLTGNTSVQHEGEIVIVTCGSDDPHGEEKTYGLWSSELEDRGLLYERVSELSEASGKAFTKSQAGSSGSSGAQSISLDALFGTTASQQQNGPPLTAISVSSTGGYSSNASNEGSAKGLNLLDSIFSSAQPQSNGHAPIPPPPPPSQPQQPVSYTQKSTTIQTTSDASSIWQSKPVDDAAALMAMIGLTPPSAAQQPPNLNSSLATAQTNQMNHSSGSSTMKASAYTPGPPPAVPQNTRPPVVPNHQKQQHQASPTGQTDASGRFGTQAPVHLLPRGLDRQAFPGELVKTLFSEPKFADALFGLYQSGQF